MNKIKRLHPTPVNNEKPEDKKAPVDLSTIPDGAYQLEYVGGGFIKKGNTGVVVISLRFTKEELSQMRFDVPIGNINLGGNIIVPGVNPQAIKPIIKP